MENNKSIGMIGEILNEFANTSVNSLKSSHGLSLYEHSQLKPVYLIFLRHLGCTFCKQVISGINQIQDKIDVLGLQVVFVHMSDSKSGDDILAHYKDTKSAHISDVDLLLYQEFEILRGTFSQVFGLSIIPKFLHSIFVLGHHNEAPQGDSMILGGFFIYHKGKVVKKYISQNAGDVVNLLKFIEQPSI